MHKLSPKLALVAPCYNESEALPISSQEFLKALNSWIEEGLISAESFILFVDDGSKDDTWNIIKSLSENYPKQIHGLKLAQNVGHQPALFAGLKEISQNVDCAISIDADLQDDINCSKEMILEYKKGRDIVYGVRKKRETDTFFKRNTARAFYVLMTKLGAKIVYDHADYRLLSKNALHNLSQFSESHLFLRGLVMLASKNSSVVYYDRNSRVAGESKYPFSKMLAFAWNGITSFSTKPLQLISVLGILVCLISAVLGVYALYRHFIGQTMTGWTSMIISIYFLGGVQLLSLGVIGQYIGKIYMESKKRPHFFVEHSTLENSEPK